MAFEVFYAIAHPEPLYPHYVFMAGGVLKFVQLPEFATRIYVDAVLVAMNAIMISTALLFIFRYCQTVDGWLHRTMSDKRKVLPIVVALMSFALGAMVIPMHMTVPGYDEIRRDLAGDKDAYELVEGRSAFGFKVSGGKHLNLLEPA